MLVIKYSVDSFALSATKNPPLIFCKRISFRKYPKKEEKIKMISSNTYYARKKDLFILFLFLEHTTSALNISCTFKAKFKLN